MNNLINLFRLLIDMEDMSDTLAQFYINTAIQSIIGYLRVDTFDIDENQYAIVMQAIFLFNNQDSIGLESAQEGEFKQVYGEKRIPSEIRAIIGPPRMKVK